MTKINLKFIITVAAIVFASLVIGLGALAINKINKLNDKIENLNSRITQIDYNNSTTQNRIDNLKNEIQRQLEEQSRNYSDVSYKITDIDAQKNTAVVEVYFSLKESPLSGEVEVSYGKDNQFIQIAAAKKANGKYTAELKLQIDKDYEISYSVTLSTVKTEKLLEIHIFETLRNRFSVDAGFQSINRGNWKLDFYISNGYLSDENLRILTATLEVFKDGALMKTINIKDHNPGSANGYESYGEKEFAIEGLTTDIFDNSNIETRIKLVDYYGLEYIFGKQ